MALKISELSPIALGTFQSTDLFEVSVDTGGGFVSRKITGSEMIASIGSSNLGNANLVANANQRTYKLLGNLSTDTLSILNNAGSYIVDFQGDQNARFHGIIGVNGVSPTPGYGINSNGSTAGVRGQGGYYGAIFDGTNTGAYINGVAAGGEFHSSGGHAILGIQGSGLSALKTDGKSIAINYKVNADYGTLSAGDEYYASASDILANGDLIKAVKI